MHPSDIRWPTKMLIGWWERYPGRGVLRAYHYIVGGDDSTLEFACGREMPRPDYMFRDYGGWPRCRQCTRSRRTPDWVRSVS